MRILLATVGTRGDVQPFVALAVALRAAGHEVCIASHREHEALVRAYGIPFRDGGASMRELLDRSHGPRSATQILRSQA